MLRIRCMCGQIIDFGATPAGGTLRCPRCRALHPVPVIEDAGCLMPGVTAGVENCHMATASPIVGSVVSVLVVGLVLLWALLAAGGTGGPGDGAGLGGSDTGSGVTEGSGTGSGEQGDGPGSGTEGEGTGAGREGTGTGGGPPAEPAAPPDETVVEPVQKAEPLPPVTKTGLDLKLEPVPVATPPPPSPRPSQDEGASGREGAAGGGGSGAGAAKDPGARGDASFTLTWTYTMNRQGTDGRGGPDIDIWVVDPLGQKISTSRDGMGMGPTQEGGQADFDDLGGYGQGDGGGPERIFWPDGKAPKGAYRFGVCWFQGQGTARYTLRVYRGRKMVEEKKGLLRDGQLKEAIQLGTLDTSQP